MDSDDKNALDAINSTTLKHYFGLLRHWSWLILLGAVLGASGAFITSQLQHPIYQASARVMVIKPQGQSPTTDLTASLTMQQVTQTYIEFFKLGMVLSAVQKQLNVPLNASQISATIDQNTQFIYVSVEDVNPQRAAKIVDALIQVVITQSYALQGGRYTSEEKSLSNQITQEQQLIASTQKQILQNPKDVLLSNQLNVYQQIYTDLLKSQEDIRLSRLENTPDIVEIGQASWAAKPVRPNKNLNTFLGGVAGLVLVLALIIIVDSLDDTIKNKEDVKRILHLNVIGYIADVENKSSNLYVVDQARSPISEAFRVLRTNLDYMAVDKPICSILVTSATPGEGKTTVAANLAGVLAQSGKKVLLIDADFRRPNVHRFVGINNRFGLSDLFRSQRKLEEVIQVYTGDNDTKFGLITTGALPPNPAELLASERMRSILEEASRIADVVILDSPPSLVTDAQVLASRVDGVLLVMLTGKTHREVAKGMLETLQYGKGRILGVVLNRIKRQHYHYGGYGSMPYGYYAHYLEEDQPSDGTGDSKLPFFDILKRKKSDNFPLEDSGDK